MVTPSLLRFDLVGVWHQHLRSGGISWTRGRRLYFLGLYISHIEE